MYGKSKWFLLFHTFAFFKLKTLIPHYHHCSIYILINVLTSGLVFSYASSSTLYTGHSHGRWVLRLAHFQNNIVLRLASLLLLLLACLFGLYWYWCILITDSSTLYPYEKVSIVSGQSFKSATASKLASLFLFSQSDGLFSHSN